MKLPENAPRLSIREFIAPPGAPYGWNPAEENPDSWQLFKTASVILGHDPSTKNTFPVYRHSATSEMRDLAALVIELDQTSDELQSLMAMLQVHRGHDEYEA